ncbi:MAG TPA: RNA-binding protein [Bacteroidia bacterium]|jgi:RNA recognition motif-containing protein|nr:RNA-binding protein [Bacteroidia bacterium]
MNIYVRNLNFSLTEDELREVFAQFGAVDSVKIIKDKFTGRAKGFGFVEMPNEAEGSAAIEKLNGTDVKGRNMFVDKANPPKAKE